MNNILPQQQIDLILSTGTIKTIKGEEFIISKYNDLEIVYRKKDMYINAGKMCVSQGKRIKDLFKLNYWKEQVKPIYLDYLNNKSTGKILPVLMDLNNQDIKFEDFKKNCDTGILVATMD